MPTSMLNLWNNQVRDWKDPGFRNRFAYNMAGVPIFGDLYRWDDNRNFMNDYMKNYGLSWNDIKYPTQLPGAGNLGRAITSGAMMGGFVSSNLARLYSNREYVPNYRYRDIMYV